MITWSYICGLIETDGCFVITLSPQKGFHFYVTIPQRSVTGLLPKCQAFFKTNGIGSTIDESKKPNLSRIPALRIFGPVNCLRLCHLLDTNVEMPFCSQKLRDFLIFKTTLQNRADLKEDVRLDMLMNLRKTSQQSLDITKSFKISRSEHEKRMGILPNQSFGAGALFLDQIDLDYSKHQQIVGECISNKSSPFLDYWYIGLIDGDGYFALQIIFTNNAVRFYPVFALGMESSANLTLDVFQAKFSTSSPIRQRANPKTKKITSFELGIYGNKLKALVAFCKINPPISTVKIKQLDLVNQYFKFKKNNQLDDLEIVCHLIEQCYVVNALGKNKGLKYSLEKALRLARTRYKPGKRIKLFF